MNHLYMSDLIGDEYLQWHNERVILDGGTGSGKTKFILDKIAGTGKKVLYLCNRKELRDQVRRKCKLANVRICTYQYIEKYGLEEHYDYVVADECHYFTSDSTFNLNTDKSYEFLKQQTDNVVIYMSATAKKFFWWLVKKGRVSSDRVYTLKPDYSYVTGIHFYWRKQLPKIVNNLSGRILIFVNSAERMLELHKIYGDSATYICSKNAQSKILKLYDENWRNSDKRILIATKVLDNGIDFKDRELKYIFSEIADLDILIQSLGRKRPLDETDTCEWYIMDRSKKGIRGALNTAIRKQESLKLLKNDKDEFFRRYKDRKIIKDFIGKNSAIYIDGEVRVNNIAYTQTVITREMYEHYYEVGFKEYVSELLGKKITEEFLHKYENRPLYKSDQEEIAAEFYRLNISVRSVGIKTFNKILDTEFPNYKLRFTNKDSDGKYLIDKKRDSSNCYRKYWVLADL